MSFTMIDIAQHLPVEIIREILRQVEPAYIFNAVSVCKEWLEAGKDILVRTLDEHIPETDSRYLSSRHCYQCLYQECRCPQASRNYDRIAKWRAAASENLSWYQAGCHTVQLSFMENPTEQTSKHASKTFASKTFASGNGRFLLRNEVTNNRARNSLFSTEDVKSFIRLGENWRQVRSSRRADIIYQGDEIMADDLQPSFITEFPSTAPLVDVSYYQHREPSLILSSYRNFIPEDHIKHDQSIQTRRPDKTFPAEHCVDIAMLSEEREVHLLTVTLEYITLKKTPSPRAREKTLKWHVTSQGSISNVCQGRGPLNAILLDVNFEAVVIACYNGVEIICLDPRKASPGDKLKGSTRKWIDMCKASPPYLGDQKC